MIGAVLTCHSPGLAMNYPEYLILKRFINAKTVHNYEPFHPAFENWFIIIGLILNRFINRKGFIIKGKVVKYSWCVAASSRIEENRLFERAAVAAGSFPIKSNFANFATWLIKNATNTDFTDMSVDIKDVS